jgi:peptidoglycan/xylan/chitin deacetylase (PgdA/CDA1 family)
MASIKNNLRDVGKRVAGSLASAAHCVAGGRSLDSAILVYHRICDPATTGGEPTMNVTPTAFRQQMASLQEAGYRFVPLRQFIDSLESRTLNEKTLVVTFDDIFQNVFLNAFPILMEFGIPATVFVATAYLDSPAPFPFDSWGRSITSSGYEESFLPVTSEQCIEMRDTGLIEIGAHTHTHRSFKSDFNAFDDDLAQCMGCLRSRFELDRIPFAFPFGRKSMGAVNDEMVAIVREHGAYCALTTDCESPGHQSTAFGLGRFNVYQWDTGRTIRAKVGGWYDWAPRLQDKLLAKKNRKQ